ncbi:putative RNA helicase [Lupinus albus]|uniref:Putative RNA helicase n=1 Tax=Lupinus albus TaxID=3870 RepID=A0A6A4QV82_LUPAL|nr:putative RNA helicase [Lupinus albus]
MLLEKFKQRKLKGSSNGTASLASNVAEKGQNEPTMVVSGFKELGLNDELVEVLEGIGDFVPSEIQCVAIPTILEGKCVLLSSPSGPEKALAFLLPLIQLLRQDLLGSNSNHPRSVVLCATEDKAEECFNAAKYIIHNSELKSAKGSAPRSNTSIGLIIGTPYEILQYIEEGSVVPVELRYLVVDDVDYMLGNGLGPEIHKILTPLLDPESKSNVKRLQTVLATSSITEVLGEQSPIVKNLERDHAGNISAMCLEMDQTEVFHFIESLDSLRGKVAEAMDSLLK